MDFDKVQSLPTDTLVGAYLQLRSKKEAREKEIKDELKPLNTAMEKLNAVLTDRLAQDGSESIRTKHGTVYKTERRSVKVNDWEAALDWIKQSKAWGFLERRMNKTAVETFLEENGELPPGVSISRELRVNVRQK